MTSALLSASPDDPLLEVYVRCQCGKRSTNLRIFLSAARRIAEAELFEDGFKIGTWKCWRCRTIGVLSARALHFSDYFPRL